ncbi:MAG: HIT domain-containing protein [Nanoarchaeota archaeon]
MKEHKDCIFCKIVKGEIKADIVYSDDNFIGILDINPEMLGHILVMPKKHFENILDTPSSLGNEFLDAIKKVSLNLAKEGEAEGFNILFNINKLAGQEVAHVHAHILPRKQNDGMKCKIVNGMRDKNKKEEKNRKETKVSLTSQPSLNSNKTK